MVDQRVPTEIDILMTASAESCSASSASSSQHTTRSMQTSMSSMEFDFLHTPGMQLCPRRGSMSSSPPLRFLERSNSIIVPVKQNCSSSSVHQEQHPRRKERRGSLTYSPVNRLRRAGSSRNVMGASSFSSSSSMCDGSSHCRDAPRMPSRTTDK